MLIVHVHVRVKNEHIEDFMAATKENAENSRAEPGILRFDVLQSRNDPSIFILTEIYRDEADTAMHKETGHYRKWRKAVEDMMAEPRHSETFRNVSP